MNKTPDGVSWDVYVQSPGLGIYQTTFRVEQQFFRLAYVDESEPGADPGYAKQHCEFIQQMFLNALEKLGIRKSP